MPLETAPSQMRPRRRLWPSHKENGQSLIELALTLPLFALLLLGTAEIAYYAWGAILTANAARAGAAYGSQNSVFASDSAGISSAAANDSTGLTGMTTTRTLACYCSTSQSTSIDCSNDLSLCPSPNTVLKFVQVNTTAQVPSMFSYPGLPTNFTVHGQAIMQVVGP